MPRNNDLHKILLIGSGPIIIGQGCEFDYSGVQACKALREEGYQIVLVNSNPATIMTDPEFADRTYIEPITPEVIEAILEREKPDALLPTMGGQTALNAAMELNRNGALARHNVRLIGANAQAIAKGEDRQLFKEAMLRIGLDVPRSGVAHSISDASRIADSIGEFPLIIRPAFTLGGSGGGIAYNRDELDEIVERGLALSPVTEVLIEESLVGWKEFEMEVMRDCADNCVVICSIENFDRRAHRRFDHGRARANAFRQGIPVDARCLVRRHPRDRRRDRRIEHPVCRESAERPHGRHRNESARLAFERARLESNGIPNRQNRGKAGRGLHARRNPQRHHARNAGQF
jgi:carbamoylphosphate synthase large subunit